MIFARALEVEDAEALGDVDVVLGREREAWACSPHVRTTRLSASLRPSGISLVGQVGHATSSSSSTSACASFWRASSSLHAVAERAQGLALLRELGALLVGDLGHRLARGVALALHGLELRMARLRSLPSFSMCSSALCAAGPRRDSAARTSSR